MDSNMAETSCRVEGQSVDEFILRKFAKELSDGKTEIKFKLQYRPTVISDEFLKQLLAFSDDYSLSSDPGPVQLAMREGIGEIIVRRTRPKYKFIVIDDYENKRR